MVHKVEHNVPYFKTIMHVNGKNYQNSFMQHGARAHQSWLKFWGHSVDVQCFKSEHTLTMAKLDKIHNTATLTE